MKIEIKALAIHELGQRPNQEDSMWPQGKTDGSERLFIVCDGMGGHERGEVASQIISKSLGWYIGKYADGTLTDQMLLDALSYAYDELDKEDNGELRKMGTTLTLFYAGRQGVTVAHIGDSRIYHIRPGVGMLYKSRDHSLVYDLYWNDEIGYDEMAVHPQKNVITKAITTGRDNRVEPSVCHISDIREGDWFYLCSDGMLEQMTDEELVTLLTSNASDADKRQELIEKTRENHDNHTAWMLRVLRVTSEPGIAEFSADEVKVAKCNALNKPRRAVAQTMDESTLTQGRQQSAVPYRQSPTSTGDVSVVGQGRRIASAPKTEKTGYSKLRIVLVSLLSIILLGYVGWWGYDSLFSRNTNVENVDNSDSEYYKNLLLEKDKEIKDLKKKDSSNTSKIDSLEKVIRDTVKCFQGRCPKKPEEGKKQGGGSPLPEQYQESKRK